MLVTEVYCLFNVFGYKSHHACSLQESRNTLMEIGIHLHLYICLQEHQDFNIARIVEAPFNTRQ